MLYDNVCQNTGRESGVQNGSPQNLQNISSKSPPLEDRDLLATDNNWGYTKHQKGPQGTTQKA